MYNTKYAVSYKNSDIFLESDAINNDEKDFVIDAIYRNDLLNIFNMGELEEATITKHITDLYKTIARHDEFFSLMKKAARILMSDDAEFGFLILFSFDYLDLTHSCLCELIETGQISSDKIYMLDHSLGYV